ncbi:DNA/RNA non-specific endonuclease [Bradyrhizobium sp. USDA 4529]
MEKIEKAKRLGDLLKRISPDEKLESVARPRPSDEILLEASPGGGDASESGLQKLAEGRYEDITDSEMFGLEAIIMPENRPVVFVRSGTYDQLGYPWTDLNAQIYKGRIDPLLPLVGRIEVPNSPNMPYAGTGFVVGKNLIATNRHVARSFSRGLGLKIRYTAGDAGIDFMRQVDSKPGDDSAYLAVQGVEMIHPYWDMALLRVSNLPSSAMLHLSTVPPETMIGSRIVAIGYPARDYRSDLAIQDHIFGGKYLVKRLQPGVIRQRALVRSFENRVNAATHDASTLGGNSGSAVIDVETGKVVALHFAGEYLKANYAVPMYELARDRRVAPLLNFDGAVESTNDWDPIWRSTEADEVPMIAAPSPGLQSPLPNPPAPVQTSVREDAATWTVPIHISVSVGAPTGSAKGTAIASTVQAAARPEPVRPEEQEGVTIDQDYSGRPGYDPDFLEQVNVPLPRLSEAMEKLTVRVRPDAALRGDPFELAYYHYSVYMNRQRRTAWFSAANIDGDSRPNIGKRQGDRWYVDARIKKSEQLGQDAFEPGIDRGHLTRREDTAWGDDVASALAANNDTFHFTNCSLQASPFNRGKDRWQGLEQFLLEKRAKKDKRRMTVVTGPIFASNDPVYKNDRMDYSVRCPLQFWKVCVLIRQDDSPSATAFVLGQEDIADLSGFEEAFDVAATQITLSDLERRTGLDFGHIKDHDHFAQGGQPGTLEVPVVGQTMRLKIIRSGADIVM